MLMTKAFMARATKNTPKVGDKWYRYSGLVDKHWEYNQLVLQTWKVDAVMPNGLLWVQSEEDKQGKYRKLIDPLLEKEWVCRSVTQALQDFMYRRLKEAEVVEAQLDRLLATVRAAECLKESWDAERTERGAN